MYLKATIIYRCIFFWIWDYDDFTGIIFCYFYLWVRWPIIQLFSDQQTCIFFKRNIVMLRRLQGSKTFVCAYKLLRFCTNTQKFQTLVPAKIVTLRYTCRPQSRVLMLVCDIFHHPALPTVWLCFWVVVRAFQRQVEGKYLCSGRR